MKQQKSVNSISRQVPPCSFSEENRRAVACKERNIGIFFQINIKLFWTFSLKKSMVYSLLFTWLDYCLMMVTGWWSLRCALLLLCISLFLTQCYQESHQTHNIPTTITNHEKIVSFRYNQTIYHIYQIVFFLWKWWIKFTDKWKYIMIV